MLDGEDVSRAIRQARITRYVSDIAKIKAVRECMVKLQREFAETSDSVLDGRDVGTIVFPRAEKKFYLDANFQERVRRRHKELIEGGQSVTRAEVEADLRNRDTLDSTRAVAPLRRAEDAVYVDTTQMSIEEAADTVLKHIGSI